MAKELEQQEGTLRELFNIERQLIEITDEELVDVQPIQQRTSALVRQYFQLYSRLQDQQSLLAEVYDHTKEFVTSVQDLQEWLPVATAQLDEVDVASAEPSVENKLETVQVRDFTIKYVCRYYYIYNCRYNRDYDCFCSYNNDYKYNRLL